MARMETTQHTSSPSPTGPSTLDDPRPQFAAAVATATATINAVTDEQLDRPTPCRAFDVAALLDHLVLVAPRIASLGRGAPDYTATDGGTAGWSVSDIAAAWNHDITEAGQAWDDPESLTRMITLPWTTMAGDGVLRMYLSELIVHTWDLARATDQHPSWDAAAVAAALTFMETALPADIRGDADDAEVPFAPVVPTADDAPAIDRLVALVRPQSRLGLSSRAPARSEQRDGPGEGERGDPIGGQVDQLDLHRRIGPGAEQSARGAHRAPPGCAPGRGGRGRSR